jgi:hypothetical protein
VPHVSILAKRTARVSSTITERPEFFLGFYETFEDGGGFAPGARDRRGATRQRARTFSGRTIIAIRRDKRNLVCMQRANQ